MVDKENSIYFLGGHDLEMAEIARVLQGYDVPFVDRGLDWAHAAFSAYETEIGDAIHAGKKPILVELRDIPADMILNVDVIDHHGPNSGHLPTSLEQVLVRLGAYVLTREQALIAANDKGYIEGMAAMGATAEEIARIRCADRQAQGITAEQEAAAEAAIASRKTPIPGLSVIELPHGKTAAVTDRLSAFVGGPGYRNLLVKCPREVCFFGNGKIVAELNQRFGGYCGGELPERGYWGLVEINGEARLRIQEQVIGIVNELSASES
jgi:hypothetical protein